VKDAASAAVKDGLTSGAAARSTRHVPGFVKHVLLPPHSHLGRFLRRLRESFRERKRNRPKGRLHSQAELLARADEFNRNAEGYWRALADDPAARAELLRKPLTTAKESASILYRLGIAVAELRLGLGHVVLDLGAGACWLSAYLNRLGARTIAMDVSPTALELGRELFRLDPRQRLDLEPQFLTYDGRKIPLPDASVDRVVCFDAFHHVPNEYEVLAEIARVLRPGGRAVFAEPGEGHSHQGHSVLESQRFQVLENELDLPELFRQAEALGFTVTLKPYADPDAVSFGPREYFQFMRGRDLYFPIDDLRRSMRECYLFVLAKGEETPDSRNPNELRASIGLDRASLTGPPNAQLSLLATVTNRGDTTWVARELPGGGYVRLGGHLTDTARTMLEWEFLRAWLPADVPPGGSAQVAVPVRMPAGPGRYVLRLDLVDEGIAWFEQHGSPVAELSLEVRPGGDG
jgi:SAM-dependent methyltransferase